jgi:hypothetical protein
VADVSAIAGRLLAWITAVPPPTPVTGTTALVLPEAKVTLCGTVATAVFDEVSETVTPLAGAADDIFKVRFWVVLPFRVRVVGVKLILAVTRICETPAAYPVAAARTLANPALMPVTDG